MNRRERTNLAAIEAAWDAVERCQALISRRRRHDIARTVRDDLALAQKVGAGGTAIFGLE